MSDPKASMYQGCDAQNHATEVSERPHIIFLSTDILFHHDFRIRRIIVFKEEFLLPQHSLLISHKSIRHLSQFDAIDLLLDKK